MAEEEHLKCFQCEFESHGGYAMYMEWEVPEDYEPPEWIEDHIAELIKQQAPVV